MNPYVCLRYASPIYLMSLGGPLLHQLLLMLDLSRCAHSISSISIILQHHSTAHDVWRFIEKEQWQNQRDSRTCQADNTDMSYQGKLRARGHGQGACECGDTTCLSFSFPRVLPMHHCHSLTTFSMPTLYYWCRCC